MAQYEQNAQSFGDDYTNGDYTFDESQMMAEGDPSAPPMSPDGASANQPGSPHGQGFQDEDEDEIDVEAGEYEYEDDEDDYLKDAEYEYEVGGLNCLWKPDRPSSFREFTGRCGTWLALNWEQIASGITGKSSQVDVFSCLCLYLNQNTTNSPYCFSSRFFFMRSVGVTQIPEVASAALMAGINPIRALQATWIMNVITAVCGGRPG